MQKGGNAMIQLHATTICCVRRGRDDIAIGGDGQVTMGETAIMKNGAVKVKKIFGGRVLTGFAGSVADAFTLTEMFENEHQDICTKIDSTGVLDDDLKQEIIDISADFRSKWNR